MLSRKKNDSSHIDRTHIEVIYVGQQTSTLSALNYHGDFPQP